MPTATEQSSKFTNLQDMLTQNCGAAKDDILGRTIQRGTVLDPGTTRFVAAGAVDPVSGLTNSPRAMGTCAIRSAASAARNQNLYPCCLLRPEHASGQPRRSKAVKMLIFIRGECGPAP